MIRMVQVVFADRVPTNSIPRVQSPNLSASRMNRGYLLISGYGYAYPGQHFVGQHWDFSEPLQQVSSPVASDTSRSYSAILQRKFLCELQKFVQQAHPANLESQN